MAMLRSVAEEADWLLRLHGSGNSALPACLKVVSDQFAVIQSRSQLLLTLSTLTFTITGFSGPQIARSGLFARNAIVLGLVFVLLSTIEILLGSLRVQWVTQTVGDDPHEVLCRVLTYRNQKTQLYRAELMLLVVGLAIYVSSVITYLLTGLPPTG